MTDNRGLNGKVVIITGGCGDIGGATMQKLASFGARVIAWDLLEDAEGRQRVSKAGGAAYMRVDQGRAAQVRDGVREVAGKFGRIDVAIGNAAIAFPGGLLLRTPEEWEQSMRVNVIGSAMLAQASIELMRAQQPDADGIRGKVLFTSSWVGAHPRSGCIDYCVAKAAIDHLVRVIGQEFATEGIRVNAVSPGILDAGMSKKPNETDRERRLALVPVGEFGTTEHVADAFVYLSSRESNYMTGHVLVVDGGCSLHRP